METNYQKYDYATLKTLIDSTFPQLKKYAYRIWSEKPNALYLQCYIEPKEKYQLVEFYGHIYKVDLDKKTLTN